MAYTVVVALGLIVGFSELVGRYRDSPASLFRVPSAWLYLVVNGAASAAVYRLAEVFNWRFGATTAESVTTLRVMVAGIAAMAALRSSFSNIKVGETTVAIGPSAILASLLAAADRGVDRVRTLSRMKEAVLLMKQVSYAKARLPLTATVLAGMQNASVIERTELLRSLESLDQSTLTDAHKSLSLGLILMTLVGKDALAECVSALSPEILS